MCTCARPEGGRATEKWKPTSQRHLCAHYVLVDRVVFVASNNIGLPSISGVSSIGGAPPVLLCWADVWLPVGALSTVSLWCGGGWGVWGLCKGT